MNKSFDFWFDFSCPYAYLASTQVEALAERTGATLKCRPMLLGGVFRAVNQPQNLAATLGAAKAAHMRDDLRRFAAYWSVPLRFPSNHPMRTVTALRALLVVEEPSMALVHAFFKAYWVDGVNLASDEGVAGVLNAEGYDGAEVVQATKSPAIKEALRVQTDEAIAQGVFGAPAFGVSGEMFWGQDRMHHVELALGGAPPTHPVTNHLAPVDFWFDFSSPFAAIANSRAPAMFGEALRYRPMLLGAVFKAVGTSNVPLFEFSGAKRAWAGMDVKRQAASAGFPLKWPSRFPMRTVLPLRVLLQIGPNTPQGARFIDDVFRAYWCDDRDISAREVIAEICSALGLDGDALIEGAGDERVKALLFKSTEEAVKRGVFGTPTFIVDRPHGERSLFWGSDRMELALGAAQGNQALY